ncbi:MAG: HU family DNA-binding protein [Microcoleaceae cyanobacterium]
MNKQALVEAIALEIPSLSRKEINHFLKTFTAVLERGFQEQGTVRIDGFGTIKKLADGSPAFRFFPSFARDGEVLEDEADEESTEDDAPEPAPEPENTTVTPMRKRGSPAKKK